MSDLVGNPEYRFSHNEAHLAVLPQLPDFISDKETSYYLIYENPMALIRLRWQTPKLTHESLLLAYAQIRFFSATRLVWCQNHGVQRKMISVDIFFIFLRLLFFALLLLFVT